MGQLEDALREVALGRANHEQASAWMDELQARIDETEDGKELRATEEDVAALRGVVSHWEAQARAQTAVAFRRTGNKRPAEGASIRMAKTVVTNASPEDVKAWAMENMPHVLRIHAPTFNAQVKTGGIPSRLASVTQEPRGALAKDLSSWLTETREAAPSPEPRDAAAQRRAVRDAC